ncbi:tetraspanin-3-like [Amphibalanus amphitrite]|uniref:tetraspanin-3-like n=1 Tax=Amphibalanus amphitrite TaxID=1232801 RepID=UPI001C92B375|nr:tetraspanin-3-like [Amphibalanus amphitrite]
MSVASTSVVDPTQITLTIQRTSPTKMGSGSVLRALKLAAFGLDVLLTLLGVLLAAGGGYCAFLLRATSAGHVTSADADPAAVLTAVVITVVILATTAGALLVVVGLLGCCGVARGSRSLLLAQACVLGALLLLLIATLAVVIWSERSAPRRTELAALELIRRRGNIDNDDLDVQPAWRAVHAVQRCLRCCGVLGYGDYVSVNASIPVSCCRDETPSAATPARCRFSGLSEAQLAEHPLLQRRGCGSLVRRRLRLLATLVYCLCGLALAVLMAALSVSCYVALNVRETVPVIPAIHASVQSLRSRNHGYD